MPRPRGASEWSIKPRSGRKGVFHAYRVNPDTRQPEWVSLRTADPVEAEQAFADFRRQFDRGPVLTVSALLDSYIADRTGQVEALKRLKEAVVPLKAKLGRLRPDQVDDREWKRYALARKVSAGTLRRERNVLVAAFNLARRQKLIASVPDIAPPPSPPPRSRYLTAEEADRLLKGFASEHARLLYGICLFTGCRKGAAIALTWDRVDFGANRIDFREPGKLEHNKRRAIVPMGKKLRAMMLAAYKVRTGERVIEWNGEAARVVRKPFLTARKNAGLGRDVTPHILRHTAASWLAMGGVPIEQASDLLACDPKTLRTVYRKFDPSYLKGAVDALDRFAAQVDKKSRKKIG